MFYRGNLLKRESHSWPGASFLAALKSGLLVPTIDVRVSYSIFQVTGVAAVRGLRSAAVTSRATVQGASGEGGGGGC